MIKRAYYILFSHFQELKLEEFSKISFFCEIFLKLCKLISLLFIELIGVPKLKLEIRLFKIYLIYFLIFHFWKTSSGAFFQVWVIFWAARWLVEPFFSQRSFWRIWELWWKPFVTSRDNPFQNLIMIFLLLMSVWAREKKIREISIWKIKKFFINFLFNVNLNYIMKINYFNKHLIKKRDI